ncbi:hypothetical protein Hanom_Chr17g01525391 [Helianthus anomalus]
MSLMCVPRDPRAAPIYAYKGKGYSLMNVLDPEVDGEMTTKLLSEGKSHGWSKSGITSFILLLKI